jgi:hypothetical protein
MDAATHPPGEPASTQGLLEAVHQIGTQVLDALAANELDDINVLLDERHVLVAGLCAGRRPSPPSPAWDDAVAAVSAQHEEILEALSVHAERLRHQLDDVLRMNEAQASYDAATPPPTLLHTDLRG